MRVLRAGLLLSISVWCAGQEAIEWRPPAYLGWYPTPIFFSQYKIELRSEVYGGFVSSNIVYRDVIKPSDSVEGTYDLTVSSAINKIIDRNYLNGAVKLSPLKVMWQFKPHWQLNVDFGYNIFLQSYVSRDLLEVLWYGNAPYRGETKKLDASFNFLKYYSLSIGITRQFSVFTVGFATSIIMPNSVFYTLSNEGEIFTSYYIDTLRLRLNYEFLQGNNLGMSPRGIAFSGGIAYQPIAELFLYAHFSNVGFITIPQQSTQILKITSNSTYTGTALNDLTIKTILYDTLNLDAVVDSVRSLVNVDTLPVEKKSIPSPLIVGTGLSYQLDRSTHLWADLQLMKWKWAEILASFGISKQINSFLIMSIYYAYKFRYPYNLGISALIHISPRLEIRFSSDNILGLVAPKFARSAHATVGIRYMTDPAFNKKVQQIVLPKF